MSCKYSRFALLFVLLFSIGSTLKAEMVKCDVLVVGGGTAGVVAAIQSGRVGAKTVLMEAASILGGNATIGGVNSPESFYKWKPGEMFNTKTGRQVIAGIGWEWCQKTVELDNGVMPDSKKHYRINPALYAAIAEEICLTTGVELRYFESPVTVVKQPENTDGYNWKVETCALGEMRTILCRQLIDCTGNATLCALAGARRVREKEIMAGSFNLIIQHKVTLTKENQADLQRRYDEALKSGKLQRGDVRSGGLSSLLTYPAGNYIYDADNSTAKLRTDTNIRGRQCALRILRFIRSLPGGESAIITTMFPEVGVRETWRIDARHNMKVEDYLSGKIWPESICFACYQIDLHKPEWKDFVRKGVRKDIVPTVPLSALIPKNVDNIVAAGRCIGSDRETLSAVRIQATCMATGQAAGAVAALAARQKTSPDKVNINEVKDLLKKNNAIVP